MELKEATFNNKSRNLKQKQNQSSADTELNINLKIQYYLCHLYLQAVTLFKLDLSQLCVLYHDL